MAKRGHGKANVSGAGIKKGNKAGMPTHDFDAYEEYFGKEATMARNIRKQPSSISEHYKEGMSLGERLSVGSMGPVTHSGRGHGRKTTHGRRKKKAVPFRGKKDSIHFLEALVTDYRLDPRGNKILNKFFEGKRNLFSSSDWANLLSRQTQYFDCDVIWDYVSENYKNMYPDENVPPSPDCVLPAENVALYLSNFDIKELLYTKTIEVLFLCVPHTADLEPSDPYFRRHFHVFLISTKDSAPNATSPFTMPLPLGNIVIADTEEGSDHVFEHLALHEEEKWNSMKKEAIEMLRIVAAMLQTINQPRYVRRSQRDVSQIKRQRIKNALGRYIPDAWNMISWNVDEPVMAKTSEEGTGSRQGLHYRRGHWRKAESHWAGARWSETRLRWETYIHGYEAGHPKYGVLKSYHVPRKDKK